MAFTPGSDGGSPITSFSAQCRSTNGGVLQNKTGTTSPITVTGLTPGKSYHCRVRATNAIGTGPYSDYGDTRGRRRPSPAHPPSTDSTPGERPVKVDFTPGSDGGSPITSFSAQCRSTNGGVLKNKTGPPVPSP